jgi:hypothetical protein
LDTVYIDEGLLPNQTYLYKATTLINNKTINSEAAALTMDTTSHNFTWQTWTFGEHSSSTLYDVAIINGNNIWAVGEIYMKDSLGNPDPKAYNAVHWDGVKWELKRIPSIICGNNTIVFRAIYSIHAFNENNIFFTDGGEIIHFDGISYKQDCSINSLLTGKINKLWGTSSSDLYAVGNNGNIAHYNGTKWTKIESGTDLDIYDIWGDYNLIKNSSEIYFIAAEHLVGPNRKIFSIESDKVKELSTLNIPVGSLYSIWFKSQKKYYVTGNGIYVKNDIKDMSLWDNSPSSLTPYYSYAIRGLSLNDIFICGAFGESLHFNGVTWKTFRHTLGFSTAEFLTTDIKKDLIISAGYKGSRSFLVLGRR